MLKVYEYCLDTVLIIDTGNKTCFIAYAGTIKRDGSEAQAREKARKITKASIKRYINKYDELVVSPPILNEFAPNMYAKVIGARIISARLRIGLLCKNSLWLWKKQANRSLTYIHPAMIGQQ